MNKNVEILEEDLDYIAEQIKEGFTSGRADAGDGKHITWEFKAEVWNDDE